MNRRIWAIAIIAVGTSAGCASTTISQREASGRVVGCGADEVTISDDHAGWTRRTWKASCRGTIYDCSATERYARDTRCASVARAPGS